MFYFCGPSLWKLSSSPPKGPQAKKTLSEFGDVHSGLIFLRHFPQYYLKQHTGWIECGCVGLRCACCYGTLEVMPHLDHPLRATSMELSTMWKWVCVVHVVFAYWVVVQGLPIPMESLGGLTMKNWRSVLLFYVVWVVVIDILRVGTLACAANWLV